MNKNHYQKGDAVLGIYSFPSIKTKEVKLFKTSSFLINMNKNHHQKTDVVSGIYLFPSIKTKEVISFKTSLFLIKMYQEQGGSII